MRLKLAVSSSFSFTISIFNSIKLNKPKDNHCCKFFRFHIGTWTVDIIIMIIVMIIIIIHTCILLLDPWLIRR